MLPGPGQRTEGLSVVWPALSLEASHQAPGTLLTTPPDPCSCEGQPPLTRARVRGQKTTHKRGKERGSQEEVEEILIKSQKRVI